MIGIFSPTSTQTPTLQPPGKGEGLEIELVTNGLRFNQSYLHDETMVKISKRLGLESF